MSLRNRIQRIRERFSHGSFMHSVLMLVGGSAFSQALMVLALPLLTRLYTPADFSVLAVYASILVMVSVVACLRLEIAIPLPDKEEDAANLLALALVSSASFGVVTACIVLIFPEQIIFLTGQAALLPYLWLIPMGVWLASSYAALQFWAMRKKRFSRIARTRIAQATGAVTTQAGFGWVGIAPFGLLLGHMVNSGAGFFRLGRDAWREDHAALKSIRFINMRQMLCDYDRFPKYSMLEALANNAGIQLPVIIIASLALGPEAGYLLLATRVMAAPMALIGGAVSQVYLTQAPEELRNGRLGEFTGNMLSGLLKTGVGPLLCAGLIAPDAFVLIFGEQWARSGELVAWMTLWFVFQFLSSPVSMVMHVTNRQRQMLLITVSGLVIRLVAMSFAFLFFQDLLSEFYAISSGFFYVGCFVIFYKASGVSLRKSIEAFTGAFWHISAWILVGLSLKFALEIIF